MDQLEFEESLRQEIIDDCTQSGDNFDACEWWFDSLKYPTRNQIIKYLAETGAWTKDELSKESLNDLKIKFLWVCAWNVKER